MANPKRASLAELLTPAVEADTGQGDLGPEPDAGFMSATPAARVSATTARVGLYLAPAVAREVKLVAFTHDRKPHDIYLEAVDLVLKKYGRPSIRELSTKV